MSAEIADVDAEARRQLGICDACRYCEGLCAVFPALERRDLLTGGDLSQLANLCHDCRACFEVCMYAPPHSFGVNLPQVLAARRNETIRALGAAATPSGLILDRVASSSGLETERGANARRGVGLLLAFTAAVLGIVVGLLTDHPARDLAYASPYRVVSEAYLLIGSGAAGIVAVGGFAVAGHRYWRAVGGRTRELLAIGPLLGAVKDAASLRYLDGGGIPCSTGSEARAPRRVLHQMLVVGLALTLVATVAAAVFGDVLDHPPPYAWASLPVIAGAVGGSALLVASIALRRADTRRDRAPRDLEMVGRDAALLDGLALLAVSGIASLCFRSTAAGAPILVVHLVVVWAAVVIAPWTKLSHALYRFLALARDRIECRAVDAASSGGS